jgi:hypothetical protein
MTDTDIRLIMDKLNSIGERLSKLEEEVKELKPKDISFQSDDPNKPYYIGGSKGGVPPCIFDDIPLEDRMKPMCISCPCPKCTPYC